MYTDMERIPPHAVLVAAGILAFAVPGSPLHAQENPALKLSGSIRVRYEALQGQFRPGLQEDDDLVALRSSLVADWARGHWRLYGEVTDSRAYATHDGGVLTGSEVNALEPVQAFVAREFHEPSGSGNSAAVQLGRFTLNLGSRRLVASDEYRNTQTGYTGLRADLRLASKAQATLIYVLPQQRRPDAPAALRDNKVGLDHEGTDQQLWAIVASKPGLLPGGALGEFSYIGFNERDNGARATRDRKLANFGARAIRDPAAAKWDYELEGIYQAGHVSASTASGAPQLDVGAYFVHADAGYTFIGAAKLRLSAEFDYASGDGPGPKYQRFDTLFGMRRADLGPSSIYSLLARTNLRGLGVRLEATPGSHLEVMGTYRALWAADRTDSFSGSGIRDASGSSGRYAGLQLEGRVRYWIVPQHWRAELNAAWFDRAGLMRDAPNASPYGDTTYGSAALTYSF
jgi:hypothetical protein